MLLGFVFVVMGISYFPATAQRTGARCVAQPLPFPRPWFFAQREARRIATCELVVGDVVLLAGKATAFPPTWTLSKRPTLQSMNRY